MASWSPDAHLDFSVLVIFLFSSFITRYSIDLGVVVVPLAGVPFV